MTTTYADRDRIDNFDREHGPRELDPKSDYLFYRDGARRYVHWPFMTAQPADDEYWRLDAQAYHCELRARRLARDAHGIQGMEHEFLRKHGLDASSHPDESNGPPSDCGYSPGPPARRPWRCARNS
ncbi:MAG: hypothetical protein KY475_08020 [Planctomycetes bacterium]|nr:hypothetical protein [Planctomycetota bacterium]